MKSIKKIFWCAVLYVSAVQAHSVGIGVGPLFIDGALILLPNTQVVETSIPLVSQSSAFAPWIYGVIGTTPVHISLHKKLQLKAAVSGLFFTHCIGIVRSFFKNPLDPTSARSIPYQTSLTVRAAEYDVGLEWTIPYIFNDMLSIEVGYAGAREWRMNKFLNNTTIFYERGYFNNVFFGLGLAYESGKTSYDLGYKRVYSWVYLKERQNNSPERVFRWINRTGNLFSFTIGYEVAENVTISQQFAYGNLDNPKVGKTKVVSPDAPTTVTCNIGRLQTKTIILKTTVSYAF